MAWQMRGPGPRPSRGAEARGRHFRGRRRAASAEDVRRIGFFEALALLLVCGAFIAVFAFALSRPARTDGSSAIERFGTFDNDVASTASPPSQTAKHRGRRLAQITSRNAEPGEDLFDCQMPSVTDGDTLRCGALRVRLASIDAPELPGHCRAGRVCTPGDPFVSSEHLQTIIASKPLACRRVDIDHYGRTVAFCSVGGRDLSCAQVTSGNAVVRYGRLSCQ